MNFKEIKQKAITIYNQKRSLIIPEFFYIGYVGLLAQYLQSGLFSFFVSLFLCPIGHGYVKCAMKLVDEPDEQIDYKDSLVGIFDFIRVAPAYLMRKFVILFGTVLLVLPFIMFGDFQLPDISLDWFTSLGNAFIQTEFFLPNYESYVYILSDVPVLIICLLIAGIYIMLSAVFAFMPYIIEEDEYSWYEALELSIHLMKKHLIDYIKLYMHFFLYHFVYWFLTGLFILIISPLHEAIALLSFVASLFLYIELFKGKFEIAKYLFYKEMKEPQLFD